MGGEFSYLSEYELANSDIPYIEIELIELIHPQRGYEISERVYAMKNYYNIVQVLRNECQIEGRTMN